MGYKVVNKNAIVNPKKNIVMDTIFYFSDLNEAKYYLSKTNEFKSFGKKKSKSEYIEESILEPMTDEEEVKFGFEIPLDFQIPHKTVTRPYKISKNEPYWVQTSELLMPRD